MLDRSWGDTNSGSIFLYPLTSETPSSVGTRRLSILSSSTLTYPLSQILLICEAIEASVPIELDSIRDNNSDSVR